MDNHTRWHNKSFSEKTRKNMSQAGLGRKAWNKGLTKAENSSLAHIAIKLAQTRKGKHNPNWGGRRPHKEKLLKLYVEEKLTRKNVASRFNVSETAVDKWLQFYGITLPMKEGQRRRIAHLQSLEYRKRASEKMKKIVSRNLDMYLHNLSHMQKPTSIERHFMRICEEQDFPFDYVGDGAFWIGNRNPDFINMETKLIVETLGEYWHTVEEVGEREKYFKACGYKSLMIWQNDLKNEEDVIERVREWINGNTTILPTQHGSSYAIDKK